MAVFLRGISSPPGYGFFYSWASSHNYGAFCLNSASYCCTGFGTSPSWRSLSFRVLFRDGFDAALWLGRFTNSLVLVLFLCRTIHYPYVQNLGSTVDTLSRRYALPPSSSSFFKYGLAAYTNVRNRSTPAFPSFEFCSDQAPRPEGECNMNVGLS